MTRKEPRTESGKRLLEQEAYNSRSFPLITLDAILAIEAEASRPPVSGDACSGCHGRRWTEDENWSPAYPETWRGERSHGDGLIPCGLCNEGGWETPDYAPVAATPPERSGLDDGLTDEALAAAMHEVQCPRGLVRHMIGTPGFHCGDARAVRARLSSGGEDAPIARLSEQEGEQGREHVTDADDPLACWCGPYRDTDEPTVIIHRKDGAA